MENEELLTSEVEDEDTLTISPEELEAMDAREEAMPKEAEEPYENLDTIKIDENMPDELKQQLAKFNRQNENLNNLMTNGVPADAEYAFTESDDEDFDENDDSDETVDDIAEDDADVGDLF